MKNKKMKRVVLVFTNNAFHGKTDKPTGWYLPEAAHPYHVFKEKNCEILFASPNGKNKIHSIKSIKKSK